MPNPLLAALVQTGAAAVDSANASAAPVLASGDAFATLLAAFCAIPTALPGLDGTDLNAVIAALMNRTAIGVDAALFGWDALVNTGADIVATAGLTPAAVGVAVNNALTDSVLAALAALGPLMGPIAAPLFTGTARVVNDISAMLNTGMTGLGSALAWKAQLDAVLADFVATGGIALVNGLADSLSALTGLPPIALPDIGFGDAATALAIVVNHVAAGLDAAMLTWDTAVNLGADIVGTVATTASATVAAISGAITDAVLAGISALANAAGPLAAPLFTGITTVVSGLAAAIDYAVTLPGAAIAWKAQLDAVLADLVSNGGVALVNGLTTGLLGTLGAVPAGLPDIGPAEVSASLTAVVDHVTVGLPQVFLGAGATVAVPPPTLQAQPNPLRSAPAPADVAASSAPDVTAAADTTAPTTTPTTTPTTNVAAPEQSVAPLEAPIRKAPGAGAQTPANPHREAGARRGHRG